MTDIHTIVRQLTQTHVHRQPYTFEGDMSSWDTQHTTTVPALIDQLAGVTRDTDGQRGAPASKPAANLEALDTLLHIDLDAARWVRDMGEDDPGDTKACVRKVYALAASAHFCGNHKATVEAQKVTCCTVHAVERDIRRWWTQARIVSGWDMAAWKPNNTCPMCAERRSLRIRSDDMTAMCVSCRETWDTGNIGLLAEHVRAENGETEVIGEEAS